MFTVQIVNQYSNVINTLFYKSETDALAATSLIEETIAKGKFRNGPDALRIEHDAGVAVFRGADIFSVTTTDVDKWEAMKPELWHPKE